MESIVARSLQVLLALGGAYLVALWFTLVVWTFRDIETRSRSVLTQVFSTLLVVLFFVPGVLLYMILRPKESLDSAFQRSLEEEYLLQDLEELPLCRTCQHYVEDDFQLCPHCQTKLREACPACERLVDLRWSLCPYCGADQSRALPEPAVAELPTRWVSPAALRRRAKVEQPERVPHIASTSEPAAALGAIGGALAAPVRLFDRRKTREMARLNGSMRLLEMNAAMARMNGTTGGVNGNVESDGDPEGRSSARQPATIGSDDSR